jgi:hypothetical protein
MFKVFWQTDDGFTGMTEKSMSFKDALNWADAMNKRYPECRHWTVEVEEPM